MRKPLSLSFALAAALSVAAVAAGAQPVEPLHEDAVVEGRDGDERVDRRCLKYTGSRLIAEPTPHADGDRSLQERRQCAMAPGTAYTREDLERTGEVDLESALRRLDPRVY